MDQSIIPNLLAAAVVLPLLSFFIILVGANYLKANAAWISIGAIGGAAVLSFLAMFGAWLPNHWPAGSHHGDEHHASAEEHPAGDAKHADEHAEHGKDDAAKAAEVAAADAKASEAMPAEEKHGEEHADAHGHSHDHAHAAKPAITGEFYLLGQFGNLRMNVSYYIDALTISMFCMVTLIATCIHFYAMGYMHDELHPITDNEVHLSNGQNLKRPGRFPRFFQSLSLFCFSMLGLVLSGNIALVFCFWELVGICSYFLIGFYVERKSASTAANKAFIVNRVGDFGMIIGLLALWSSLGTFAFGDIDYDKKDGITQSELGIFSQLRAEENHHELKVPQKMLDEGFTQKQAYWLLIVAGVGIFCGCVGKSAQFPLHVWLPDAMEGPTPVSALVHSATMVAAGVYLVGRFMPAFVPEVLLVIAISGCITLFIGATIAITATDIKRVLAYSTISQLGYMMMSLGVGGWAAGLMHLVTHAFFKSLLFMCSGSVIHAVHTNDMRRMGGLFKKMPVTAITMLIGCLAIAGVGVPFLIGFSGYYSKDAILEQAYSFQLNNKSALAGAFFVFSAGGAAITAFYMFRMWFMTFVGKPRDAHAYDHAHESPPVMYMPLVILSVFAIAVAWDISLLGYGVIASAFFIVKGIQQGWFKGGDAHGHDDHAHGHDSHGHDSHGHDAHGHQPALAIHAHDDHGHGGHGHGDHGHDSHGHEDHGHDSHGHDAHGGHHGGPVDTGMTPGWVGAMLLATILGGWILSYPLSATLGKSPLGTLSLVNLIEQARPEGILTTSQGEVLPWVWPNEHDSHAAAIKVPVTLLATSTWIGGILLSALMYAFGFLSAEEVRRQFSGVYTFLVNKWWFDELYHWVFVRPVMFISNFISSFDKQVIDRLIDILASITVWFSKFWVWIADRVVVDGTVDGIAARTYGLGLSLKGLQTGRIRQYVLFIAVGAIAVFVLIAVFGTPAALVNAATTSATPGH